MSVSVSVSMRALGAFIGAWGACACAPVDDDGAGDVDAVSVGLPRAIVEDCAQPPAVLQARLWISGSNAPCALEVDVDAGTTTGTCAATPGVVRTLTLDWFVVQGGFDVVVAQAQKQLDLSNTALAEARFEIAEGEVAVDSCLDMTRNQVNGSPTISFAGNEVPVCDIDNGCNGAAADGCANLGEICAGLDPFDAGDDP